MEGLFISVLNMSLTASYVIAAIMLVRPFLKKAPKIVSYALWAVAGFRLAFPFSFESTFSLIPFKAEPATNFVNNYVGESIERVVPSSGLTPQIEVGSISNYMLSTPTEVSTHFWLQLAGVLWLIGIAALLIYSVVSILLLNRRLSGAVLSEGNIYEAENLKTPFVLGFIRPKIYIPTGLPAEEKSYIILHEQTHIRRFDHVVKLAAFLILCVHWLNPFVWIAFILMSADMEMSCDERVLKEMGGDIKKAYSTSLLSMATGRCLINGNPLAFGEGNIKGRIKNVLNFKKPAAWAIAVSVVLVAALSIGFATNRTNGNSVEVWSPQPEIEDQDEYFKALEVAQQSVKTKDVIVDDLGSNEKIAQAWMDEWFAMLKALPENNMARITDGVIDSLEIIKISKEGLAKAFVFSVTFSVRPTYPIGRNAFWMAGNTGNSPGRDETWGQMYREVELRLGDDGRYHFVSMGTGAVGRSDEYRPYTLERMAEQWELITKGNINKDSQEAAIYLDKSQIDKGFITLHILDEQSKELWSGQFSTSHTGWDQLFLCDLDGKQYLLRYNPAMFQGYCTYVYTLFTLENGNEKVFRTNKLEFDVNGTKELDVPKMLAFAEEVNVLLGKSTLLISSNGGDFHFGPSTAEPFYERYSWLDANPEIYERNDSLEVRLNKYSKYTISNRELSDMIAVYKNAVEAYGWFDLTILPTSDTFREYNGTLYAKVTDDNFKTLSDLENYLRTLFSDSIVRDLLNPKNGLEKYRDFDGALYAIPADRGSDITKGEEKYEIVSKSASKIIFRITVEVLGEWDSNKQPITGYETHDFTYEKIDGRWVFTTFSLVR